ncbi:efflux RND transporter periplasmic adaptor subunit [Gaoshiqia sediminis]|uniref:Efflux RND transporter periplasmic adaptor subunit n=1 Tax=Gaoshiqia sediminis TaxID=2986998 RepID=A0AA42C9E5_9BACT|nr:efflux RND transporter periplasmic adaptor subunit [Gaoshiqia sediminis]MCW0483856.1 efflux RND transporter periplasmic adaptor subunit [Gaoshiqia sediminis]
MKRARQLVVLVMAFVLASCAGTPDNSVEAKRKQLTDYKKQRLDLETKIAELEKELDANSEVKYVNVKALALEPRLFEHFVEVTGKVEADQEVNVSPEGSGKIIDILVREGQHVQKGTVLANLNTDMLDQSIAEAKIGLELAQTTFDRQKNLWDQKIGSELQFLQAKSNKESMERRLESLQAQKEMAVIKSPVDGVVDVIFQKKGEIASPQFPFAKVVNISRIKIYGDVAESYLTKVKTDNPVSISFPAISRNTEARITQIGNYIDPNNRTFRIRLDLSNPDGMIKPNMIAILKIRDYVSESAFVVPSLLIKSDFRGKYTYVVDESDPIKRARKVYVTTGVSANNLTEVTEGLGANMKVISEGFDQVIDGSAVHI